MNRWYRLYGPVLFDLNGNNNMRKGRYSPMGVGKGGFTLIELLVVIAVIALLMSILMPALNMAREQGRRVVCASNEKFTGMGMMLYSSENDGKFPSNTYSNWANELSMFATDQIVGETPHGKENGTKGDKHTLYCPSIKQPSAPGADHPAGWQFSLAWAKGPPWVWQDETGLTVQQKQSYFRIVWYFWLLDKVTPDGTPNNLFEIEGYPAKGWVHSSDRCRRYRENQLTPIKLPANTELITDETLSDAPSCADPDTSEWGGVALDGGYPTQGFAHWTGHLRSGRPSGSNVFFLDGHREWRPFQDGRPSSADPAAYGYDEVLKRGKGPAASWPYFWW